GSPPPGGRPVRRVARRAGEHASRPLRSAGGEAVERRQERRTDESVALGGTGDERHELRVPALPRDGEVDGERRPGLVAAAVAPQRNSLPARAGCAAAALRPVSAA